MARALMIRKARPAELAIALVVAGLLSADSGVASSQARPGGTVRDAAYARIAAPVEQVTAELPDPDPRAGTSTRPLDMAAAGPDPTLYIPEPKPHGPSGDLVVRPMQHVPQWKPHDRDRSDEVVTLLKEAGATTPDAVRNVTADASQATVRPSAPIPAQKAVEPQEAHDRPSASGAQPGLRASAAEPDPAVEALRQELEARDLVIANLLQRVEQLERRIVLSDAQLDQAVAGAAPPRPGVGFGSGAPAADAPEPAPRPEAPSTEQVAAASEEQAAPPAAPGQFEVDEDAVDRALERTLVEQGVLLLPWGQAQIEPSFTYTREETETPTFVTEGGTTFVGEVQVRRNEFTSGQNLRVGLPFDAQAEISLPYRYVDQSTVTKVGFGERNKTSGSGYGFGDISVGLAKTLLRENGGWWPDLVGRVRWDTDTGKSSDGDVPLGGGFNEIAGSLSAVKRQDPLAFVAGVSYERAFEHNDVRPGDEVGFSIGTVLAASPETSLSLSFSQNFSDEVEVDGSGVDGSDGVDGVLSIGAASILGHGLFVNTSVDIGVTDDAPDYAIRASVPIRFSTPGF
jgi:hypothetical protein